MEAEQLPLSPIEEDFDSALERAVGNADRISEFVAECVRTELRNVYFVGAGGSLIASCPAFYLLHRMVDVPVYRIQSNELYFGRPRPLGHGSLVIIASHSGKTAETVTAAKYCREAGARVLAATRDHSPLSRIATQSFEGEADITELLAGYALCEALGVELDYAAAREAFVQLPGAFLAAVESAEPHLHGIATALRNEPITYVLGSGPSQGSAHGLASRYLQQMQWMHAAGFDAADFFHGAFEVVREDTPVILLLGEDPSRPIAERAQRFLETYTQKAHYLDVRDLDLLGMAAAGRAIVSPLVLAKVIKRLAKHYEAVRGHCLSQRRYKFRTIY